MIDRRQFASLLCATSFPFLFSCRRNNMKDPATFVKKLAKFERPFIRLELSEGDPGPLPVMKLGGVPWWPKGIERPRCVDGHDMGFVAQIRLDEVPGFDQPPMLLSFHYCEICTYEGKMPFGWEDAGHQLRYRLSLFRDLERTSVDGLGIVGESRIAAQKAEYAPGRETLGIEDIWERFPETRGPGGIPASAEFVHEERTKIGGWPSWVQQPVRPQDEMGNQMDFVGQLDLYACPDSAWCTGYAYLFASPPAEDEQEAELIIQTT